MEQLNLFLKLLKNSFRDLLPIVVVFFFFQAFIIQEVPSDLISIAIGMLIVAVGLAIFIQGLEIGIFPVGINLANEFARKGSFFWLSFFAFFIGFSTTIAEPALIAIAGKAETISNGLIDAFWLRIIVALSVGSAITLGVIRILLGHPIHLYIIAGYVMVVSMTFFTPPEIIGLAYDSGGITTSTVTVPLVAALGVGLATSIKGRNPMIDGFGLIAFASLTPMIFVQVYGIIMYAVGTEGLAVASVAKEIVEVPVSQNIIVAQLLEFLGVVKDVLPIILVILFFQYIIIRKPIPHLKKVSSGFLLVILGLYAFIVGLEMALFPLGESMAERLIANGNVYLVYLFGLLIGFSTTMAEPALIAVAVKAREISSGKINDLYLRIFVAIGVAIGISLGAYRIVVGDAIHYYIIAGYAIVIVLTFIAPKYIVPIAYDSGGVTTSTVTVPLVAALGLGLASNIEGRDVLIDGFGLIAFASLFPMITVMSYGILSEYLAKRSK